MTKNIHMITKWNIYTISKFISINQSVCLSDYLSVCLSVCLSKFALNYPKKKCLLHIFLSDHSLCLKVGGADSAPPPVSQKIIFNIALKTLFINIKKKIQYLYSGSWIYLLQGKLMSIICHANILVAGSSYFMVSCYVLSVIQASW